MQNGGVSLVPKMEDHKPMPVSESFTQLLDNTNKNTTVSTSSAPLWSSSSSGYGVMDSNNKESKGFTRMIFQQHQQADSSYPCGPFTRLLDPSSNITPDNLELSLDDFGTSTAATTTTTTAMQQQVPMPLQSLKPPTSSIPTFHGNKTINFGSKSQDGSSNNSINPLRQKVGSPSSSSTSSNTTLHKSTVEEGGECTTEQKRSAEQAALNPVSANSNTSSKKTKVGSSGGTIKVRKEKLGERITALQHLVSPYGKTDTASVLLEAMGYIKFLQEQVQVLSSPYLKGIPASSQTATRSDQAKYDLRSRGLCLVPVSCTMHVANDNGADFWTSGVGSGSKY